MSHDIQVGTNWVRVVRVRVRVVRVVRIRVRVGGCLLGREVGQGLIDGDLGGGGLAFELGFSQLIG